MNPPIRPEFITTVLVLAVLCASPAYGEDVLDSAVEKYEGFLMSRLAQVKSGSQIKPFSTDGCSGGLSEGWRIVGEALPLFRSEYGETPPWEHCCITHDKRYWRGETDNGYAKRKQADEVLRQCVIDTGKRAKATLVAHQGMSEETVTEGFSMAAELMYSAVRVGGQPCSVFPWRWGYGWPNCIVLEKSDPLKTSK